MRGDGREDVAAMEGGTDWVPEVSRGRNLAELCARTRREDHAEQAVVGSDEAMSADFRDDCSASAAYTRIDDGDVNCATGEIAPGLGERVSRFGDGIRCDFMRDIEQSGARADAQHDAFHSGDVVVGEAEIGEEGDDGGVHLRICAGDATMLFSGRTKQSVVHARAKIEIRLKVHP